VTSPVSIEGRWQMIRAEHAGEAAPDLVAERTTIELANGEYIVRFEGNPVDRGTFEVGAVVGDYTLLLRGTSGPNAGRTIPCMFQIRGDRLRLCYGLDGLAPTEFATDARNQRYLATYRRAQ
jgi:uncharacterized protein (TIGR03067 family)